MSATPMTYAGVGVDYDAMDPFKRAAQLTAKTTANHLKRFGYKEVEWSRGESCYLYETSSEYRGSVIEGLGTKNLVADAMYQLTGRSYYDWVARDTIAMIVNDMITLGCMPRTINMHVAAGSSDWFKDEQRCADLIAGWKEGCDLALCTWAGGETPTLKGMVESRTVILSGSAEGEVKPKSRLIKPAIQDGDVIVLLPSSGIHANGLTMARSISNTLPHGYLETLAGGQTYGDALLQPTVSYVRVIKSLLDNRVEIHHTANITGHGWRKLMRATEPFVYVVDNPGEPQPLFTFLQEHGPISDEEAYGNLNMGAGFAIYVPESQVSKTLGLAKGSWRAGYVEKSGNDKRVIIPTKNLVFEGSSLAVR